MTVLRSLVLVAISIIGFPHVAQTAPPTYAQLQAQLAQCKIKLAACQEQCQHNGVWDPITSKCENCDYSWIGQYCDRRPTDCSEAAALPGYTGHNWLVIKPDNYASEFTVWCQLDYGGWTFFQKRGAYYRQNANDLSYTEHYDRYVAGFGAARYEYWLGLDKMKAILDQGNYTMSVGIGQKQSYYRNAAIGSAASYYPLSFSSFERWPTHPIGNGFEDNGINNMRFCASGNDCDACGDTTPGNDCIACGANTQSGWWFGNTCSGANLNNVAADNGVYATWPNDDTAKPALDIKHGYLMVKRL